MGGTAAVVADGSRHGAHVDLGTGSPRNTGGASSSKKHSLSQAMREKDRRETRYEEANMSSCAGKHDR